MRSGVQPDDGRIIIHYPGGTLEIDECRLDWWAAASPELRRAFAQRLAQMAEDPTLLTFATDGASFVTPPGTALQRPTTERCDEDPS